MAREGADVTIVYLPAEESDAKWTISQIEKSGRKGHMIQSDLSKNDSCKQIVEEHMKVFGRLNILINNGKPVPQILQQLGPR